MTNMEKRTKNIQNKFKQKLEVEGIVVNNDFDLVNALAKSITAIPLLPIKN